MEKVFDALLNPKYQQAFVESKKERNANGKQLCSLEEYILGGALAADADRLRKGDYFLGIPCLTRIEKNTTGEKRDLYVFRGTDHFLLSFMAYILLQQYDSLFSDGLYSFRLNQNRRTLADKIHEEIKNSGERPCYALRTDVRGYSKNIDQDILIRKLNGIFQQDPDFMNFLSWLIRRNRCMVKGQIVDRYLSAMPGCPLSDFFANVYLMEIDALFRNNCDFYCRYTDDILVLSQKDQKIQNLLIQLRDMVRENKLELKESETKIFSPHEPIAILGFLFEGPDVDISPEAIEMGKRVSRINAKKAAREIRMSGISREEAARRFIENALWPFMKRSKDEDRYYARLFYPVITRDDGLREIDHCLQHCMRYILTGKWGKAQYRATYDKLKSLGYVSIVHMYHNSYKDV